MRHGVQCVSPLKYLLVVSTKLRTVQGVQEIMKKRQRNKWDDETRLNWKDLQNYRFFLALKETFVHVRTSKGTTSSLMLVAFIFRPRGESS
jgi:hypothetical protein